MTDVRKLLADALVQAAMEDDRSPKVTVSMRVLEIMVGVDLEGFAEQDSLSAEEGSRLAGTRPALLQAHRTPGGRLRYARKALGMSAATLAGKVGLSASAVRNQENGTNGIPPTVAEQYAEILGGAPGWYLFGPPKGSTKGTC